MTTPVRPVERRDAAEWLAMRRELWPDGSSEEHAGEIQEFFAGRAREPLAVLVVEDSAGRPAGIAELSIRPCAEGCRTDRVAFLEGWFVRPEARRRGLGRALIRAAEAWALGQGCAELASDTGPGNVIAIAAHKAAGFADAGALQCFRKDLR